MLLNELFQQPLAEWGQRGFGGYGRGFFTRAHYVAVANIVCDLPGAIKQKTVNFFADAFAADNPKFKPETFIKACDTGASNRSQPRFQMRHFYYLAEIIKNTESQPMKEYIATLLADYFARYSDPQTGEYNFNRERWFGYCGISDPDATPEQKRIPGA